MVVNYCSIVKNGKLCMCWFNYCLYPLLKQYGELMCLNYWVIVGSFIPVCPLSEHHIQWRTNIFGPKVCSIRGLEFGLSLFFSQCITLQLCNVLCMEHYYDYSENPKVSEDIGLSKPYTTSKAYYQNAFGLKTLHFCLQDNVTVRGPKYFLKLVIFQACFETVLTRNN